MKYLTGMASWKRASVCLPILMSREGGFYESSFVNRQVEITSDSVSTYDSQEYLLDGRYRTFKAMLAAADDNDYSNQVSEHTVTFKDVDTGRELDTFTIKNLEDPVEISVDVMGVDKLEISIDDGYYGYPVLYDASLILL